MPNVNRSALVMHSAQKMYDLVNDIDAYTDFLPWCADSRMLSQKESQIEAQVTLAKGALRKSFTTRNLLQPGKMIEMQLLDGPFKHLHGFWRFESLKDGQACKIMLDLEYEFSNRIVALALGPVFNQIANSLVDAFVTEASKRYD